MFAMRNVWLFSKRAVHNYGDVGVVRLLPAVSGILPLHSEHINIYITRQRYTMPIENIRTMGFFERFCRKTGIINIQKYRHMVLACMVYENVMSQIDFQFFYKHFNMTDTFFSWFLVTELHVWMMMLRYMAEGKPGKLIRNNIVAAMWEDTDTRVINLGHINSKLKRKQIIELSQQFNAAIIGYDEGIQSDDRVLAGALWRRIFNLECNNPEHIEMLLIYVRKQICLFDNLPSHEILKHPVFKLIDIKSLCKQQ